MAWLINNKRYYYIITLHIFSRRHCAKKGFVLVVQTKFSSRLFNGNLHFCIYTVLCFMVIKTVYEKKKVITHIFVFCIRPCKSTSDTIFASRLDIRIFYTAFVLYTINCRKSQIYGGVQSACLRSLTSWAVVCSFMLTMSCGDVASLISLSWRIFSTAIRRCAKFLPHTLIWALYGRKYRRWERREKKKVRNIKRQ